MSRYWLRLDNAALIFPAISRPGWSNVFRQSATLRDPIDPAILQRAVDDLMSRFPSFYVRLRSGVFWHYLEEAARPPAVKPDFAYPLTHMGQRELHRCCLRVLYYQNRLAVEYFHALTDGNGAMVYLRTLVARYVELRYQIRIPAESGVLDLREPPRKGELEDSFLRHTGRYPMSRAEPNSYRLRGTLEGGDFRHIITGVLPTKALTEAAHRYHATVTVFLAAVMTEAILTMQAKRVPKPFRKPVKITIPVDLRRVFGSQTLRNFALTVNPGVDARMGPFATEDLCKVIQHQISAELLPQLMAGRIAANVQAQKTLLVRIMPLPVKNLVLRTVYALVGETKGCLNISNLGLIRLPEALAPYVERLEFIIGVQITYPNNCSVVSCGDVTCVNMIRNIRETELERLFFSRLVELGVPVSIESNQRGE